MSADPKIAFPSDSGTDRTEGSSYITRRALIVGVILAALMPVWPTYTSFILHSTRADHSHLTLAMLIPFVLLLIINTFLERWGMGFSPTELLTICCIGMVAGVMQGEFFLVWFMGMLTMPAYFASPENRFEELLLPYMPEWTTIMNREVVRGFYEGIIPGSPFPWPEWGSVLFWWGTFIGAVMTVNLCMSVILRKQWMERERLSFPVASFLLELTGVSGTRGTLSTLVRNRLFQFGFVAVFAIIAYNVSTWFTIAMPMMPFLAGRYGRHVIPTAPGFPSLVTTFVLLTFCLGYFTKLEVLFSLWFFHLVQIVQAGVFNRIGVDMGTVDPWSSSHPAIGWETFGGMIVFVFWGFWIARDHFLEVFKKAFLGDEEVDDSEELMSYRTSVVLLIGCSLFIFFWLHRAGMDVLPILGWSFAMLVLYVGMARIVVESGLVYLRVPITAQAFTWHAFGIANLGPASATVLTLTNTLVSDGKTVGITQMAHVPRLAMAMARKSRKALAPAVLIGTMLGASAAIGFMLYQGYYGPGAYNFGTGTFKGGGGAVLFSNIAVGRIQDGTTSTDWDRISWMFVGGAFTAVLYYLRYRFTGFPLHPIGFTICGMVEMQDNAFSLFLMWFVKLIIIKVGGLERYRQYTPFFIGMIMGYLAGITLGIGADFFWFPGEGHEIHCDP